MARTTPSAIVLQSLCALVFAGVFGSNAMAQDAALSKSYTACMDKSGGVTSEMLECADKEYEAQDKRLNTAYQAMLKATKGKRQKELRDVQRLWLAFSKANCAFYEDPDAGTSAAIAASSCSLHSTANRAKELEDLKQD